MPGLPVLVAAVVAIAVGWFNWLGRRETPPEDHARVGTEGAAMSLWSAILLAALICVALKAAGYLVPPKVLEAPRTARISDLLTVALLAALVAVQTLGDGQAITVDARVPALLVAGGLLWLRQSFLVVVAAAALVAALLRLFGLAS